MHEEAIKKLNTALLELQKMWVTDAHSAGILNSAFVEIKDTIKLITIDMQNKETFHESI